MSLTWHVCMAQYTAFLVLTYARHFEDHGQMNDIQAKQLGISREQTPAI